MSVNRIAVPIVMAGMLGLAMHSSAATPSGTAAAQPGKRAAAPVLPALSAQQVVDKYVAARGGAGAWKAVQAMAFKGKMGAGATTYETVNEKRTLERKEREEMMLPFVLESKRPNKTRLEITFNSQTAVQVYDGVNGYKYRPYLGREDWVPYSADELKNAAAEPGIDGLLIDMASRGSRVESAGTDTVEGKPAYRLKVTDKSGQVRHAWIDAASFLEVKEDGTPRKLDGRLHPVEVYLREYKPEQGLMIPRLLETAVQGVPKTEKIAIDSVVINPKLDDSRFQKAK
jgi:hypothetical protein